MTTMSGVRGSSELGRGPLGDQLPVVENGDPVGDPVGFFQVLGVRKPALTFSHT
jgi:hypothetical protein